MLSDNSVFKSETKLSPLRETFSNLKKIQKKNNAFKFQKKLNMPSSINCNFKKRIRSRMVAELGNYLLSKYAYPLLLLFSRIAINLN